MHSVKISVTAFLLVSAAALLFVLYHNRSSATLKLSPDNASKSDEYFKGLPNRLAANYFPQKDTHEDVLIEPVFPSKDINKIIVTFLVKSESKNFQRRKVIRSTWGSIQSFKTANLQVIFIAGTSTEKKHQVRLKDESLKYRDIIQVNIPDTFINQPKKSLSAFKWILKNQHLHSNFYIATEDNCVVNIATTMNFLLDHQEEANASIHCGYMFENNSGVIRGYGARSIPQDLYPKTTYPKFCRGMLVILSQFYMEKLYEASTYTNITGFHLEDVLLYGILREKLGIENSIKKVINGGIPLVFYPWDDSDKVVYKMLWKWEEWKDDIKTKDFSNPK